MRSVILLTAVLVLGVLVSTAPATIIQTLSNPVITGTGGHPITVDGNEADWTWTGGEYAHFNSDGLGVPDTGDAQVGRSDFEYLRLAHDATNLYGFMKYNIDRNFSAGGSTANESTIYFDMDENGTTGTIFNPNFGADYWIASLCTPTYNVYLDKNVGGTTTHVGFVGGGVVNGSLAFGTTGTPTRYVTVEFRIPWASFTGGATPGQKIFVAARAYRSLDNYPDSLRVSDGQGGWLPSDNFEYSRAIPEPGTLALLAAGLLGLLCYAWRRRRQS